LVWLPKRLSSRRVSEYVEPYSWLDPFWDGKPAENAEEKPGGILDPSCDENPELNPRVGLEPA
jgi:hypothetical protein